MKFISCVTGFILVSCAWLVMPSGAQETTGALEGRVLDTQGKPIAQATVLLTSSSLQGNRGVLTSDNGKFVVVALPVGQYTLTISHAAKQAQTIEGVIVGLGKTASMGPITLQEKVYTVGEVVVTAPAPLIDYRSTSMGANLRSGDYATLPIERDYRSVAVLLPQANESYLGDGIGMAGSTGLENRLFIDGIDVTDPVRGITGTNLPYNFVREVQVRTGGYEAEYRSSLGGTINAVTNAGGNETSGQVFGFFVNNRLAASPRRGAVELNTGDFARYDVGFGLGGPIARDRLWYHIAYNPALEREEVEIPGIGFYEDRTTTHSFATKLTWQANSGNSIVLSAIGRSNGTS